MSPGENSSENPDLNSISDPNFVSNMDATQSNAIALKNHIDLLTKKLRELKARRKHEDLERIRSLQEELSTLLGQFEETLKEFQAGLEINVVDDNIFQDDLFFVNELLNNSGINSEQFANHELSSGPVINDGEGRKHEEDNNENSNEDNTGDEDPGNIHDLSELPNAQITERVHDLVDNILNEALTIAENSNEHSEDEYHELTCTSSRENQEETRKENKLKLEQLAKDVDEKNEVLEDIKREIVRANEEIRRYIGNVENLKKILNRLKNKQKTLLQTNDEDLLAKDIKEFEEELELVEKKYMKYIESNDNKADSMKMEETNVQVELNIKFSEQNVSYMLFDKYIDVLDDKKCGIRMEDSFLIHENKIKTEVCKSMTLNLDWESLKAEVDSYKAKTLNLDENCERLNTRQEECNTLLEVIVEREKEYEIIAKTINQLNNEKFSPEESYELEVKIKDLKNERDDHRFLTQNVRSETGEYQRKLDILLTLKESLVHLKALNDNDAVFEEIHKAKEILRESTESEKNLILHIGIMTEKLEIICDKRMRNEMDCYHLNQDMNLYRSFKPCLNLHDIRKNIENVAKEKMKEIECLEMEIECCRMK